MVVSEIKAFYIGIANAMKWHEHLTYPYKKISVSTTFCIIVSVKQGDPSKTLKVYSPVLFIYSTNTINLFYFFRNYWLNSDSVYIIFVGYDCEDLDHRCACDCWVTFNISHLICRFVMYLSTKFNMLNSSLATAIKLKAKENIGTATILYLQIYIP